MAAYKWLEIATYDEDGTKIDYDNWDIPAVIECLEAHIALMKSVRKNSE